MENLKRILVPLDFSQNSLDLLPQADFLARLFKADLHLLHVISVLPSSFGTVYGIDQNQLTDHEIIRKNALDLLSKAAEKASIAVKVTVEVRVGKVHQEITSFAKEIEAGLILMSTQGAHGVGKGLLGSNASKVVQSAPCPVITCEKTGNSGAYKKILVPVNIEFGIRELRDFTSQYLSVMDPHLTFLSVVPEGITEGDYQKVKKHLEEQAKSISREGGLSASIEIVQGWEVSDIIVDSAKKMGADLIMLNTHGRKGLGKLVLGSVAAGVIVEAACPVLSIRPNR